MWIYHSFGHKLGLYPMIVPYHSNHKIFEILKPGKSVWYLVVNITNYHPGGPQTAQKNVPVAAMAEADSPLGPGSPSGGQ